MSCDCDHIDTGTDTIMLLYLWRPMSCDCDHIDTGTDTIMLL
jgi:hypothetical protein